MAKLTNLTKKYLLKRKMGEESKRQKMAMEDIGQRHLHFVFLLPVGASEIVIEHIFPWPRGKANSSVKGWVFPLCYFTNRLALIDFLLSVYRDQFLAEHSLRLRHDKR